MGWLQDIQKGWFGKRRDPRLMPDDNKNFITPSESHPANAHTISPVGSYRVTTKPRAEIWRENDNYRSPDPTTHDAPQHHDQREANNALVTHVYETAPVAKMETYTRAPDPRWSAAPVPRTPRTQSSMRRIDPFDQGTDRRFTGHHFSMADHVRNYPIAGMLPAAVSRRNTHRLDPLPSDLGTVDYTNGGRFTVRDTQLVTGDSGETYGRSYRLGG